MKVTLTTEGGNIVSLELFPELSCDEFKSLCAVETGIQKENIILLNEGKVVDLSKNKTLNEVNIKDGDLLIITSTKKLADQCNQINLNITSLPQIDFSNIDIPGSSMGQSKTNEVKKPTSRIDPSILNSLITHFNNHPREKEIFRQKNPTLYQALMNKDASQFSSLLEEFMGQYSSKDYEIFKLVNNDPLNPKAQEQIANLIHQKNIDANMETALEHTPESFGIVTMLYINIKVNGHPIKAFVDTGAQATLMSKACAERCNLLRLADKRWAGIAKGVGTQSIIGRIHLTQVAIENAFITCSFSILADQPMDVLLGLDILRRHQCVVDLAKNTLHFTSPHALTTPFLPESELPECARQAHHDAAAGGNEEQAQSGDLMGTDRLISKHSEDIQALVEMGFSRELATEELERCGGNLHQAASNLSKFL